MIGRIVKNNDISFEGNIFPKLDYEPSELFVSGSLAFVDAKSISNPSLLDDVFIPNMAASLAKSIPALSAGTETTLGCTLTGNDASKIGLELTTKNGLHGIALSTSATANGTRRIVPNSLLATYLNQNVNHRFFVGLSHRVTKPVSAGSGHASYSGATKNDTMCLWAFDSRADVLPPSGDTHQKNSDKSGNDTSVNLVYRAVEVQGIYSTFGDFTPDFNQISFWKVGDNTVWEVGSSGRNPSHIFYDFYLEDLTVSGRSFAEVNAIFKARHIQNHSAGGKYFGDTWTTPV